MKRLNRLLAGMVFLCILFFIPVFLISSNSNVTAGARSLGLGRVSVTQQDFWSIQNNQAGLAACKDISLGLAYENKFLIDILSLNTLGFVLPTKYGGFGLMVRYFGYPSYSETKFGFAFGRKFGDNFSAGLQLDYLSVNIAEDYGNAGYFTFEIGIRSRISDRIILAAHAFNPIAVKAVANPGETATSIFRLGLLFEVSRELSISVETEKDLVYKPLIRGGLEYRIFEKSFVRFGYSTLPGPVQSGNFNIASEYTFGFGLNYQSIVLDVAASMHQVLGWSPSFSIIYKIRKVGQ